MKLPHHSSALSLLAFVSFAAVAITGCAGGKDTASSEDALTGDDAPPGFTVKSVVANGTGCGAGSWTSDTAGGREINVRFDSYSGDVSPQARIAIKDCTVGVDVEYPDGWSFAVASVGYDGQAAVAGAEARLTTKAYFQGNPVDATEHAFAFPTVFGDSGFAHDFGVPEPLLVWSPCHAVRRLNIQSRVAMQGANGSAQVLLRQMSRVGLTWRKC